MYSYELVNNHHIVGTDGRTYLIDTGHPSSLTFKEHREVRIDGRRFLLMPPDSRWDLTATFECIGREVDGLLGMDIIGRTSLTIDKDGTLDFAAKDIEGKRIGLVGFGCPAILASIGPRNGRVLLDTGAKYGYGIHELFHGLKPFDHVHDYNPLLGHLESEIYDLEIFVGGEVKHVPVCDNADVDRVLRSYRIMAIMSVTTFFDEVCVIDAKRKQLILK